MLALLVLLSCDREKIPVAQEENGSPREVGFSAITKGGSAIGGFNPADPSTLLTFRAVLLNQDNPSRIYEAEGTYCNIYKHYGDSYSWYHAIHCDDDGNPLTDANVVAGTSGDPITGWTGSAASYSATYSGGTAVEFSSSHEGTDTQTWGDSRYALWATNKLPGVSDTDHPYQLIIASPAKSLTKSYTGSGDPGEDSNYHYGFHQGRNEEFFITPTTYVILAGTYLAEYGGTGNKSIYTAESSSDGLTLLDHRCKISVYVSVDEMLNQTTVNLATLTNYITEGVYMPRDESTGHESWKYYTLFTNSSRLPEDENGDSSCFDIQSSVVVSYKDSEGNVNAPTPAIHDFYLLAQDYSENDYYGNPIHELPKLSVDLVSSKGETIPVDIPLSFNLQPQHHYHITIRVSTWYLFLYVQGEDWNEEAAANFNFGLSPDVTLNLSSPLGSSPWEDGGSHGGTI